MAHPDIDLGETVLTETDLAQMAIKDVLGRTNSPHIAVQTLTFLKGPFGIAMASITLGRLLHDTRVIDTGGEVRLHVGTSEVMQGELIRGWETFYSLPPEEQQKLQEAARKEFLSAKK